MRTKLILKLISILIIIISFSGNTYSGPRRVLLEFSTGTWCGYCPCGDSIIEHNILTQFPQTVVLAYHGGGSGDPFIGFNGNNIISLLGISAYPLAVFDRQSGPPMDFDYNWPETCAVRYQRKPNSDVNISFVSKTYNSSSRELTATVNGTALINLSGQYKINYVITEDNVVYQQNFYALCGTPGYHPNYIHYWIVRNMVNGAAGENLNSGNWNQNQTITKTVTTTLGAGWVESNCNLIIFVYKDTPPLIQSTVEQSTLQSVVLPLGVSNSNEAPESYSLAQNYPNPFNPVTHIKFSIPKQGEVSLKVFDLLGNEVSLLVNGFMKEGIYNAEFNASGFSSGVYFYTLKAGEFTSTKKMLILK